MDRMEEVVTPGPSSFDNSGWRFNTNEWPPQIQGETKSHATKMAVGQPNMLEFPNGMILQDGEGQFLATPAKFVADEDTYYAQTPYRISGNRERRDNNMSMQVTPVKSQNNLSETTMNTNITGKQKMDQQLKFQLDDLQTTINKMVQSQSQRELQEIAEEDEISPDHQENQAKNRDEIDSNGDGKNNRV